MAFLRSMKLIHCIVSSCFLIFWNLNWNCAHDRRELKKRRIFFRIWCSNQKWPSSKQALNLATLCVIERACLFYWASIVNTVTEHTLFLSMSLCPSFFYHLFSNKTKHSIILLTTKKTTNYTYYYIRLVDIAYNKCNEIWSESKMWN